MENASKALLIAGGVLIAILLLTLFSYLFSQMAGSTSSIYSTLEEHEIAEFNQQFLNYQGRGDGNDNYLTIQDVVTIVNLAKDNNKEKKRHTTIVVTLEGEEGDLTQKNENELNRLMQGNIGKTYRCLDVGRR